MPTSAPKAAKPTKEFFDPFNSSATGHQRAENRLSGSTLWRDSRHLKLREQLSSGLGGGKRVADTVGAGSDGGVKMGLLENGTVTWRRDNDQASLQESWKVGAEAGTDDENRPTKKRKKHEHDVGFHITNRLHSKARSKTNNNESKEDVYDASPSHFLSPIDPNTSISSHNSTADQEEKEEVESTTGSTKHLPQIFDTLTFYINGSTAPLISDHRLKRLLTEHGGRISIALGRRSVTHVILSRPGSNGGSGGGLAGSKIQKEIASKCAESVKYVTAEWVVESVKAGKRLPERKFEALRFASKGTGSMAKMFGTKAEGVS